MHGLLHLTAAGFNSQVHGGGGVLGHCTSPHDSGHPLSAGGPFQKLWGDEEMAFKCPSWAGKARSGNLLGVAKHCWGFCVSSNRLFTHEVQIFPVSGNTSDPWLKSILHPPPPLSHKKLLRIPFWKFTMIISQKLNVGTILYMEDKAIQTHHGPTFYLVHA